MDKEKKSKLIKYAICFGVEIIIGVLVLWSKGFFKGDPVHDVAALADAFFVPGIIMTLFAGMLFISGEGGLIGISYVLRNVVLAFIPGGRLKHEKFADYRERKLKNAKNSDKSPLLIVGLIFLVTGIVLTFIWRAKYYAPSNI